MTNTEIFFCDTYALIELINGNPNYEEYIQKTLITSDLNLMELYFSSLKDYGKNIAEKHFQQWVEFSHIIPREIIPNAMQFKLRYNSEKLSYIDCMGYAFAQQNEILFLTGDEKFGTKENVEFVK